MKNKEDKSKKVWTTYTLNSTYPYWVYFGIDGKEKHTKFQSKIFAKMRAKKLGKILGVNPDLSFKPIIND